MSEEIINKLTNKEIIAYLSNKFPLCFSIEGEAKPLKIGLFRDLAEALEGDEFASKTRLRQALRQYTTSLRYLYGCREGAKRVDLQGNECDVLETEHALHAKQQIAEIKSKMAKKRQAEAKPAKKRNTFAKKSPKPAPSVQSVQLSDLQKGSEVKIKVGATAQSAVVVDVLKDMVRVQLQSGMVLSVGANKLFIPNNRSSR